MTKAVLEQVNTKIQVRFSDTDMMGHISSLSYASWAEIGRADFFNASFFDSIRDSIPWFIMVHLALDFKSEGQFGEEFLLETRCVELGRKSMSLEQTILANGRRVCEIKAVMVAFDRDSREPLLVPDNWVLGG